DGHDGNAANEDDQNGHVVGKVLTVAVNGMQHIWLQLDRLHPKGRVDSSRSLFAGWPGQQLLRQTPADPVDQLVSGATHDGVSLVVATLAARELNLHRLPGRRRCGAVGRPE